VPGALRGALGGALHGCGHPRQHAGPATTEDLAVEAGFQVLDRGGLLMLGYVQAARPLDATSACQDDPARRARTDVLGAPHHS